MNYQEEADFAEKRAFVDYLQQVLDERGIDHSEWQSLEVGGEGGILAGLVGRRVRHVISTDIVPVQGKHAGGFTQLLAAKFERNGGHSTGSSSSMLMRSRFRSATIGSTSAFRRTHSSTFPIRGKRFAKSYG